MVCGHREGHSTHWHVRTNFKLKSATQLILSNKQLAKGVAVKIDMWFIELKRWIQQIYGHRTRNACPKLNFRSSIVHK